LTIRSSDRRVNPSRLGTRQPSGVTDARGLLAGITGTFTPMDTIEDVAGPPPKRVAIDRTVLDA
jgi:hypothetical protein